MELTAGQTVWIYDHYSICIKEGTLHSTEDMSERDEHPTLAVRVPHIGICRILKVWVFTNKAEADEQFKNIIQNKIHQKEMEIEILKGKL